MSLKNFFRISNPIALMLVMLFIALVAMFGGMAVMGKVIPWRVVTISLLFFTMANHIAGLFVQRWGRYVFISFICYGLLVVSLMTLAKAISGLGLGQLESFQKTIGVLIMFYVLLTALAGLFRTIRMLIGEN